MAINALSYCTAEVNVISALSDKPNSQDGLEAAPLKQKFDKAGGELKTYLNQTLVPYVNQTLVPNIEENAEDIDSLEQTARDLSGKAHTHDNKSALDSYTKTMAELLLEAHPIGSIYISVSATSPASLFGGTWERIKDVFLLAAGDTYTAGTTGGEAEHTLKVNEMPSHAHTTSISSGSYDAGTRDGHTSPNSWYGTASYYSWTSSTVGGDQAHNNMPPYLTVYAWKRTA